MNINFRPHKTFLNRHTTKFSFSTPLLFIIILTLFLLSACKFNLKNLSGAIDVKPDGQISSINELLPQVTYLSLPSHVYKNKPFILRLNSLSAEKATLLPLQKDINLNGNTEISLDESKQLTLRLYNKAGTKDVNFIVKVFEPIATKIAEDSCRELTPPNQYVNTKLITDFGVNPNTISDQTELIQKALDQLKSGDRLLFPPGIYSHSKSLNLTVENVTIEGQAAELRGLNPDDQAIWIKVSNITLKNFIITQKTKGRKFAPWNGGISSYAWNSGKNILTNINIHQNILTPLITHNNDLSFEMGGGIFVYNTKNYLVSQNLVVRNYADGIHQNGHTVNGRVLNNYVIETGDDGIAIVSYLGKNWREKIADDPQFLSKYKVNNLNSNILVENNFVDGMYWGRGMSIVGGEKITMNNNVVQNIPSAAGIYFSQELSYHTAGVINVLFTNNKISNIQSDLPSFLPQGPEYKEKVNMYLENKQYTHHGAMEIFAQLSLGDNEFIGAEEVLYIRDIHIANNTFKNSRFSQIRAGNYGIYQQGINLQNNTFFSSPDKIQINDKAFDQMPFCDQNTFTTQTSNIKNCQNTNKYTVTGFQCFL